MPSVDESTVCRSSADASMRSQCFSNASYCVYDKDECMFANGVCKSEAAVWIQESGRSPERGGVGPWLMRLTLLLKWYPLMLQDKHGTIPFEGCEPESRTASTFGPDTSTERVHDPLQPRPQIAKLHILSSSSILSGNRLGFKTRKRPGVALFIASKRMPISGSLRAASHGCLPFSPFHPGGAQIALVTRGTC